MTKQTKVKKVKPWSVKKRVVTAASLSLFILLSALLLGGSLYLVGSKKGLIQRQSIKDEVLKQALENEELAEAFMDSIKLESCINDVYNFGLRFANHTIKIDKVENEACRSFVTKNSRGGDSKISITPWEVSKDKALEIMISQIQQVITESFIHEDFDGVLVRGIKDDVEYVTIIIAPSNKASWVFELSPADPLTEQRLIDLARSFRLQ